MNCFKFLEIVKNLLHLWRNAISRCPVVASVKAIAAHLENYKSHNPSAAVFPARGRLPNPLSTTTLTQLDRNVYLHIRCLALT